MVKIVKSAPMGVPDIVRFHDLTNPGAGLVGGAGQAPASVSPLTVAKDAVNSVDQWINIADKGITMLGRVDSILERVQGIQQRQGMMPPGPGPAQVPAQLERLPPGATRINSDPVIPPQDPAGDPPGPEPAALMTEPASGSPVDVGGIVQVLDMISMGQPGITVEEMSAAIKRNPAQVQHLLNVFLAGRK